MKNVIVEIIKQLLLNKEEETCPNQICDGTCYNCSVKYDESSFTESVVECKRRLVISCVGDSSLHEQWLDNTKFDSLIIYYGKDETIKERYKQGATYFANKAGIKFNLIWSVINEELSGLTEERLLSYSHIALLDDDILTTASDIVKVFDRMESDSIDLAQASLSEDSHIFWRSLKTKGKGMRRFNTVEIMMPFFNKDFFSKQYYLWQYLYTGILLDTKFWVKLIRDNKFKVMVIDDVQMKHTRRFAKGDVYKNNTNRKNTILPRSELITAFRILGINRLDYDSIRKEEIRELNKVELIQVERA